MKGDIDNPQLYNFYVNVWTPEEYSVFLFISGVNINLKEEDSSKFSITQVTEEIPSQMITPTQWEGEGDYIRFEIKVTEDIVINSAEVVFSHGEVLSPTHNWVENTIFLTHSDESHDIFYKIEKITDASSSHIRTGAYKGFTKYEVSDSYDGLTMNRGEQISF